MFPSNEDLTMTKTVSVATARRILGVSASEMSDIQVQELLDAMYLLAGEQLLYNGSNNEDKSNGTRQ